MIYKTGPRIQAINPKAHVPAGMVKYTINLFGSGKIGKPVALVLPESEDKIEFAKIAFIFADRNRISDKNEFVDIYRITEMAHLEKRIIPVERSMRTPIFPGIKEYKFGLGRLLDDGVDLLVKIDPLNKEVLNELRGMNFINSHGIRCTFEEVAEPDDIKALNELKFEYIFRFYQIKWFKKELVPFWMTGIAHLEAESFQAGTLN